MFEYSRDLPWRVPCATKLYDILASDAKTETEGGRENVYNQTRRRECGRVGNKEVHWNLESSRSSEVLKRRDENASAGLASLLSTHYSVQLFSSFRCVRVPPYIRRPFIHLHFAPIIFRHNVLALFIYDNCFFGLAVIYYHFIYHPFR